jgi:RHS repeat-associated protein
VTPPGGPTTTLGYDQASRLVSYGIGATYSYNGDGLRTAKIVGGTNTTETWDLADPTRLLLVDDTTSYLYGPGGLPLEQRDGSGNLTWYHHDQLGSTRLLTNNTGAITATYTYDPYGRQTAHTGTATTPLGFAGQYADAETGFIYLRNRYYDPATAQFLSQDPAVAVTRSAYGYIGNDPLNGTDPSGLDGGPSVGPPSSATVLSRQNAGCSPDPYAPTRAASGWDILNGLALAAALFAGVPDPQSLQETATNSEAGFTFAVDSAGETSVSLTTEAGATYEFDPHALKRMTERGISLDQARGLLESGNSFQYFHDGVWKTGFYDPASKLFIGSANGTVVTVIRGASQNYINNLLAAHP